MGATVAIGAIWMVTAGCAAAVAAAAAAVSSAFCAQAASACDLTRRVRPPCAAVAPGVASYYTQKYGAMLRRYLCCDHEQPRSMRGAWGHLQLVCRS